MPELPEIETVRRIVGPQIVGAVIESVSVNKEKTVGNPSAERFVSSLAGKTFVSAGRRGKGLILNLDEGKLIIRFGMTGQLIVVPGDYPPEKHTRVEIGLKDGRRILYIDPRAFGKVWYAGNEEEYGLTGLGKLGPEPFDATLAPEYLKGKLGNRGFTIKEALLDQSVVVGIGNIWSDEILFRAEICPEKPCRELSDGEWETLTKTIPDVMEFGIGKNAVTPEEYLSGKGRKYYDVNYLLAYGRKGEPCPECGTPFTRSVLGGRSSYWCPECQKRRKPRILFYKVTDKGTP